MPPPLPETSLARQRGLLRAAFAAALGAVTLLSLLPGEQLPPDVGWDKRNHLIAYLTLAALLDLGWPRSGLWRKLGFVLLYGAAIEGLQGLTVSRAASLLDMVANALGALVYFFGLRYLLVWWLRNRELGS